MPLVKSESGEFVGAECVNKCGQLSRLDQEVSLAGKPGDEQPRVTVLLCTVCHYCELYWGAA